MKKETIKNCAKNFDINLYIKQQIKKKIQPFYTIPSKKLKIQYELLIGQLKQKKKRQEQRCYHLRKSEDVLDVIKIVQNRNKMKSYQESIFNQHIDSSQLFQQFNQNLRFHRLKKKVNDFLFQQKQNIKYLDKIKEGEKSDKKRTSSQQKFCQVQQHRKHHRRIVTSLIKPFNFGNISEQIKKNEIVLSEQFQKFSQRREGNLTERTTKTANMSSNKKYSKFRLKIEQNDKIFQKLKMNRRKTKKRSIILEQIEQKQDQIDLQFQQGLVQQIYDQRRVKFRNRINNVKSRKNIYDGQLYFLKQ